MADNLKGQSDNASVRIKKGKLAHNMSANGFMAREVMKALPFGILIIGLHYDMIFVSDRFKDIIMTDAQWFKPSNAASSSNGPDHKPICPLVDDMDLGETRTMQIDGLVENKTFQLSYTGMEFMNQKAVMVIYEDISELQQTEAQIYKLRWVVEFSPTAVMITDSQANVEYVNPKFVELTGYSVNEVIGKNPRFLQSNEQSDDFYQTMWATLKSGNVWRGEFHNKRKNGELYWDFTSISPVMDPEGKITHFIAIKEDITSRKHMEDEIQRYAEYLEEEVQNRTNELIQTVKMASIGQLVAGIAHEINNPLAYVKSNTEFMKEDLTLLQESIKAGSMKDEYFESLMKMLDTNHSGIERIARITKTLKRFASPTGEKSFSDINQGIRDTLVMVHNEIKTRVKVHEDYGEIPEVLCNISQMNQVFMSILLNASQSMEMGEVHIKTWQDDNNVYIEFKDNGSGISDDVLPQIFDPFFTTKESGTGLGLSISYSMVKDHNGDIMVQSVDGQGTTLIIRLPIEQGI